MSDLLEKAIRAHGGAQRWEQVSRFRVQTSITGAVDILGGGPAVHYPSQYRRFDGVLVPTRRRVYVRRPDGSPILESTSIAIDVERVSFS